ncbi:MAG: helix-turn-helix domain-containing protein, partial [Pseudomonadota bacterium]|nr:helix-turn-helix domain-containing protein [Pseudomonadota bacterium]
MRKRMADTATAEGEDLSNDRQFVTALQRGLDILRAFRPADLDGLSNREIAERTGLPNSTISRLTYTLLKLGYLTYADGTGRYKVGLPALSLGYACLGGMKI